MKTVLLVNNDSFFRAAVALRAARRSGFQLLLASSRLEALWALQEHNVDLVLVDLGLPEKEGVELLIHLVNHFPELAVMTMSRPWEAQQVEVLPWAGHLSKPLRPSGCWRTPGPATCASCRTASSARWPSPRRNPSP